CDEGGPFQCSLRLSALVKDGELKMDDWVVPLVGSFNTLFRHACTRHDNCYRFGNKTYGFSREHCDTEWREMALDACHSPERAKLLLSGTGVVAVASCEGVAELYYQGFRH